MSGVDDSERRSEQRLRADQRRRGLVYACLGALALLVLLSLYGTFITGPSDRDDIRGIAEQADTVSDQLAKSNAGLTALMCTGDNRHDAIDQDFITILLDEEARDVDTGRDFSHRLRLARRNIPPSTNCGELICQFFRQIAQPGATITIQDPFGPDRPEVPCGKEPKPPAKADAP